MKALKNIRMHTDWIILALLVLVTSLINFVLISRYTLPPGSDPGSWLFLAHRYFNGKWSFHPPLFFVILGFFGTFLDEMIVNKIMGTLSLSLIAVPTFFVVKHVTHSRRFAFLGAILTLFIDAYMEMLGWGGYPNGLAIAFMSSAFYFILLYSEKGGKQNLMFVGLFSILTALTHHLSALVLIATGLVYAVVVSIFGESKKKKLLTCLITTIPSFLILFLIGILANQTQSITYVNEASFYLRRLNLGKLMYIYRYPVSWFMLVLGPAGIVATWKRRELFSLLLSWSLTPFLLTQLYLIKFPTDYVRFIFFSVQPIIIAAVYLFFLIVRRVEKTKFKSRHFAKYATLLCIIFLEVFTVVNGISHLYVISNYYQRDRKSDYYAVLTWIKENTPEDAIIAATGYYDCWIRGFSQRQALSAHRSLWLFSQEEVEIAEAAYLLLFGTYEINNGYVRARGMEPIEGMCTPLIGVRWEGEYQDILFFQDNLSNVKLDNDRNVYFYIPLLKRNTTSSWVERSDTGATYQTLYDLEGVDLTKKISVKYGIPEVEVTYKTESPRVEAINVTAYIWDSFKIQDYSVSSGQLTMTNGKTLVNMTFPNANITLNLPYLHIISNSKTLKISIKAKTKTIFSDLGTESLDYREIIKQYNVTYILCGGQLDNGYIPRFEAEEERFQMVFRNPAGTIFKVVQNTQENG